MSTVITSDLIKLIRIENNLKTLALVNANIPESAMNALADVVNESHLKELDISWNPNLKPKSFSPLLEVIG
jgi:hypothetical protein